MSVGDCQAAFALAAARDGIVLERARVPWINQRGHLGLPDEASAVREPLETIFLALGGDVDVQGVKRLTPLTGDFVHEASGTFIEIDESQHFTSARLRSFEFYPPDARLGFDLEEYRALCRAWSPRADRDFAHKSAVAFGAGGRQRQRAYHDALRDLVTPAMSLPPAPDRDGEAAVAQVQDQLRRLLV